MTMAEIYAAHAPAVFRCLLAWSRNVTVAEELTAETFYRAIVSDKSVRATTARGYLIVIARNVWRKYLARRRRENSLPHDIIAPASLSSEAHINLQRTLEALAVT